MKITRRDLRSLIREVALLQSIAPSSTDKMFAPDVSEDLRKAVREKLSISIREGTMKSIGGSLRDMNCSLPLSTDCARKIISGDGDAL